MILKWKLYNPIMKSQNTKKGIIFYKKKLFIIKLLMSKTFFFAVAFLFFDEKWVSGMVIIRDWAAKCLLSIPFILSDSIVLKTIIYPYFSYNIFTCH